MAITDIPDAAAPQWTLADRLLKARVSAELEQHDLAELTGISRQSISNYERGKYVPRRPALLAIAFATGVPLQWLAGDADVCGECGNARSRCFCASAQVSDAQLALELDEIADGLPAHCAIAVG